MERLPCTSSRPTGRPAAWRVPAEIWVKVSDYMPILDVMDRDKFSIFMSKDDATRLYESRCNRHRLLSQLTHRPADLSRAMLYTATFLAGSRAMGFFVPDLCTQGSDWDFYCCGGQYQKRAFLEFMKDLGMTVDDAQEHINSDSLQYPDIITSILTCSMVTGGVKHKVQIMSTKHFTELDVVLRFHFTIARCYVSGAEAVCLAPELARDMISHSRSACPNVFHSDLSKPRSKYEDRGVIFHDHEHYASVSREEGPLDLLTSDCLRVIFSSIVGNLREERIMKWRRRCAESVSWDESKFRTRIVRNCEPYLMFSVDDVLGTKKAEGTYLERSISKEVFKIMQGKGILTKSRKQGVERGLEQLTIQEGGDRMQTIITLSSPMSGDILEAEADFIGTAQATTRYYNEIV